MRVSFSFQASKKRAAELMIDQLKQLPPLASYPAAKPKKPASTKKKSRNLIKVDQKENPEYGGLTINPISRLIQIQQAKREKEPVYTLVAERGVPRRRDFVMQVGFISLVLIVVQNQEAKQYSKYTLVVFFWLFTWRQVVANHHGLLGPKRLLSLKWCF